MVSPKDLRRLGKKLQGLLGKSNNNNNHFIPQTGDTLGEGFFPLPGGNYNLLQTSALPYPSYPALYRQDTTYTWIEDDRWHHIDTH